MRLSGPIEVELEVLEMACWTSVVVKGVKDRSRGEGSV